MLGDDPDRQEARAKPVLRHAEHRALRVVEDLVDGALGLHAGAQDLLRGLDQVPQDRLLLDDLGVVLDVGGARHPVEQAREIGRTSAGVEVPERLGLLERHQVERASRLGHRLEGMEDLPFLEA